MKNLLEKKIELIKLPWYSGGRSAKDNADSDKYTSIEIEIQKAWLKHPDWIKTSGSPYIPATKLPAKGAPVLFIKFDKIKDKSTHFGFRLDNYRVEQGTYHGMKVVKDDGTDYCRPSVSIKVLHKDGYIYFVSPTEVILK